MNKYTSIILRTALVAGLCILLGVAAGIGRSRQRDEKCQRLVCRIVDADEREYVDEAELVALLKRHNAYPVGEYLHRVNLQQMENLVREHPMVRTAECYTSEDGSVRLRITQRVPLLKVITANEAYFVDTDRKRMPLREEVRDTVLCATGKVGEHTAMGQIADLAEWLQKDDYWRTRIAAVEVQNPQHILLRQRNRGETILLGEWNGYEHKLHNAKRFYLQTQCIDKPHYTALDLRFRSQVVGIK